MASVAPKRWPFRGHALTHAPQVLGSGIAGLTYALEVAAHGRVVVVSKDVLAESNTAYAQGGICGVLDAHDSVESHIADTVIAGAFLCNLEAVEAVCRGGAAAVRYLADLGARFSVDAGGGGQLHLAREGGHTHARVVHAADATGREIERALVAAVRSHPRIALFERTLATDLVVSPQGACAGADGVCRATGARTRFVARTTLLATGGAGHAYPVTTNPGVATGDGMAMARRAGATIANMEFVQFHPTALFAPGAELPGGSAFLISEAVRGDGGRLYNAAGERFMGRYDGRGELAPRDVVARAIAAECARERQPCAFLDCSHLAAAAVLAHFPTIAAHCSALGIDITTDRIPVTPAAHYFCGGVVTGLDGATSVPGLLAAGEVACTGLHGANRLASNSLLEGVVFGRRAAAASVARHEAPEPAWWGAAARHAAASAPASAPNHRPRPDAAPSAAVAALRGALQRVMWSSAGIVRSSAGIAEGRAQLAHLRAAADALLAQPGSGCCEHELVNLVSVGSMVLSCASQRKESRGLHFTTDFPSPVEAERHASTVQREDGEGTALGVGVLAPDVRVAFAKGAASKRSAGPWPTVSPRNLPSLVARAH